MPTIAGERKAAAAEAERLTAHAAAMTGTRSNPEAEDETLRRLTALRAAIAGQRTDAVEADNNQHGTELSKYMTQNTLRLS